MYKYFPFVALISICLGLLSCSDDDENAPPTSTELLTAKAWVVQDADLDIEGLGDEFSDTLNLLEGLQQSRIQLRADQSFEVTNTNTGQTQTGTWALLNDDTEIQFTELLDAEIFQGTTLSEEQLQDLQTYRITELSATRWEMENENNVTVTIPGVPIPVSLNVLIDITLVPEN